MLKESDIPIQHLIQNSIVKQFIVIILHVDQCAYYENKNSGLGPFGLQCLWV